MKLPAQISEEEALAKGIHPFIVKKPTEEEYDAQRRTLEMYADHAGGLLRTPDDWLKVDFARRKMEVYVAQLQMLSEIPEEFSADELKSRYDFAVKNIVECLITQGKLHEAITVAWSGMQQGVDCVALYQQARDYLAAITRPDDKLCECDDYAVEPEGNQFGTNVTIEVLPTHCVVGQIPSYKHEGKLADIVRCTRCGMMNAMLPEDVPGHCLVVGSGQAVEKVTVKKDGSTIQRTIRSKARLSSGNVEGDSTVTG